eukprot:scaffold3576_cov170-Amphora_coffeaeformis.AAC.12
MAAAGLEAMVWYWYHTYLPYPRTFTAGVEDKEGVTAVNGSHRSASLATVATASTAGPDILGAFRFGMGSTAASLLSSHFTNQKKDRGNHQFKQKMALSKRIEESKESTPLTGVSREESISGESVGRTCKQCRIIVILLRGALVLVAVLLCFLLLVHPVKRKREQPLPPVSVIDTDDDFWLPIVGAYSMPITFHGSPLVQKFFDNGLMQCYGFAEKQAQHMTKGALKQLKTDKDTPSNEACPMCYWLLAMSHAPFLNHPWLSAETLDAAHQAAMQAKQGAKMTYLSLTVKEKTLIDAISLRFAFGSPANQTVGYEAYRDRLKALHAAMPDDMDIMAFYADSILILYCDSSGYHFYEQDSITPLAEIQGAIQLLERCLEISETVSGTTVHPLCAHLYIHMTEPSYQPERANATADNLADGWKGTQAQHLQHMPSHTYLRVGRFHDAVVANVKAHQSDEMWLEQGRLPYGPAHDTAFLVHAAGLSGEREVAYRYSDDLRDHYRKYPNQPDGPGPELGWHIWRTIRLHFGDWEAVLSDSDDLPSGQDWPYAILLGKFSKGVAFLGRRGNDSVNNARLCLNGLRQILPVVDPRYRQLAKIANLTLSSGIAYAEGEIETALQLIQAARMEQESWDYTEPPDWFMTEAACEGTLLHLIRRNEEAIHMFEHDLQQTAANRFSLYGLLQSAIAAGRATDISIIRARYEAASAWSDDNPPMICPQLGQ